MIRVTWRRFLNTVRKLLEIVFVCIEIEIAKKSPSVSMKSDPSISAIFRDLDAPKRYDGASFGGQRARCRYLKNSKDAMYFA